MALKKSQRSLRAWTKQKWGTKSGKKSSETGERYLPKAARDALTSAEYAATSRKKRADTKKGKQHSKQPKKIARKTRKYRRVGKQEGGELILDTYKSVSPKEILNYGRKSVVEPIRPTPIKDAFFNMLNPSGKKLFSFVTEEISNPINYAGGPAAKAVKTGIKKASTVSKKSFIAQRNKDKEELISLQKNIDSEFSMEEFSKGVSSDKINKLSNAQANFADKLFNFQNKYFKKQTPEKIESNDLKSKTILSTAINDLEKSKDIFKAGYVDVQGTTVGDKAFRSEFDKIILGKNLNVSPKQLYNSFNPTRKELKKFYGDEIKLYRLERNTKITDQYGDKLTTNWLPEGELLKAFKAEDASYANAVLREKTVKIDDILAINTGGIRGGKYYEFVVLDPAAKLLINTPTKKLKKFNEEMEKLFPKNK